MTPEVEGRMYVHYVNDLGLPDRNDPDFAHFPFTWGVCRPDFRNSIEIGGYVFFVTELNDPKGQRITGIIEVKAKLDWKDARQCFPERIWNPATGGNILVDGSGNHIKGAPHPPNKEKNYSRRISNYVVGTRSGSVFLNDNNVGGLRLTSKRLERLLGSRNCIPRVGVVLSPKQVATILGWVNDSCLSTRRSPLRDSQIVLRKYLSKPDSDCSCH